MSEDTTLRLIVQKKWFDMIASGFKKEEYREVKRFWKSRLLNKDWTTGFRTFEKVEFKNGYASDATTVTLEYKGTRIGAPKPEWSCFSLGFPDKVFIIELGNIISNEEKKKKKDLMLERQMQNA